MIAPGAAAMSAPAAARVRADPVAWLMGAKARISAVSYALMASHWFLCATHKTVDSRKKTADIAKL
jgi:hypothetical protein